MDTNTDRALRVLARWNDVSTDQMLSDLVMDAFMRWIEDREDEITAPAFRVNEPGKPVSPNGRPMNPNYYPTRKEPRERLNLNVGDQIIGQHKYRSDGTKFRDVGEVIRVDPNYGDVQVMWAHTQRRAWISPMSLQDLSKYEVLTKAD